MTTDAPQPDDDGLGDLVPDNVPQWLTDMIRKAKGRKGMANFSILDEHYKARNVIKADKFDEKQYQQFRDNAEALKELAESRWADDPTWYELIQDEFLALYKAAPQARKSGDMKPTHLINHSVMDKARKTKEWDELRTYTELDPWASAMAAVDFGARLAELFDEQKDLDQARKEMQEQSDNLDELLDELQKSEDPNDLIDQLEQQLQEYQDAMQDLQQQLQANDQAIRNAARDAAKDAKDGAENVESLLQTFGTEPGSLKRMDHEARMKLATRIRNNKKLREMADMIGRMVRLALGEQARKIIHGHDEVHDVELGDSIHRVLPSEIIQLGLPVTKILFLKKFAEKQLLQYQLRGTERVARGSIICMIDSSGSMGGSREIWSKAVGLALLNIANKQNRDFHAILFSSRGDQMHEWYFPKGKAEVEDVLDFAEYFIGGGTDFELPISRGIQILEKQYNDERAQKGDLVLITDGECAVSDEWRDRYFNAKDDLAFRMYSCLIGVNSHVLNVLSDKIYNITDLAKGEDVREVFGFV